ncbi:MAG TPA: STAS domain-containing protein [Planctomycetota bacterium]|nr:STAS domain-containing protein [Planctomycetota bacterium]
MAGFRIQKEKLQGGVVLVGIKGFLDAHTFEQLEQEFNGLFDAGTYRLIVDLSGLDYISSAGAGVFIEAIGTAQENFGNIVLIRPGPNVKEVFDLLGLSQIFTFKDTRDEAMKSLARVGA